VSCDGADIPIGDPVFPSESIVREAEAGLGVNSTPRPSVGERVRKGFCRPWETAKCSQNRRRNDVRESWETRLYIRFSLAAGDSPANPGLLRRHDDLQE
jgi:hypothetical protein